MIKREELTNPNSCLSKARDNEMLFVLLGRDPAAPAAIRAWIGERLRLGKNKRDDPKIIEAEQCLGNMEIEGWLDSLKCEPLPDEQAERIMQKVKNFRESE